MARAKAGKGAAKRKPDDTELETPDKEEPPKKKSGKPAKETDVEKP